MEKHRTVQLSSVGMILYHYGIYVTLLFFNILNRGKGGKI